MAQTVKLSGVTIKTPSDFSFEYYNITKAERTADGTMHMDLIAKKRKYLFNYTVLSASELETITDIINGTNMFFTLTYYDNNVLQTATVYTGAIHKTAFRSDTGAWYFRDVSFDLIEQ